MEEFAEVKGVVKETTSLRPLDPRLDGDGPCDETPQEQHRVLGTIPHLEPADWRLRQRKFVINIFVYYFLLCFNFAPLYIRLLLHMFFERYWVEVGIKEIKADHFALFRAIKVAQT